MFLLKAFDKSNVFARPSKKTQYTCRTVITTNNYNKSIILEACEKLITEKNDYSFNIRQVAKISGLSYVTVYKYFKNPPSLKNGFMIYLLEKLQDYNFEQITAADYKPKHIQPKQLVMLVYQELQKSFKSSPGKILIKILQDEAKSEHVKLVINSYLNLLHRTIEHFKLNTNDSHAVYSQSINVVGALFIALNNPDENSLDLLNLLGLT